MLTTFQRWVLVILTVSVALGATIAALSLRPQLVQSGEQAPVPDARLIDEMSRLSGAIRELRAAIAQDSVTTRPISPPSGEVAAATGESSIPSPGNVTPTLSQPSVHSEVSGPPNKEKRAAFDARKTMPEATWARSHWFLSYAELIERYGPPDFMGIRPEAGAIAFTYVIEDEVFDMV